MARGCAQTACLCGGSNVDGHATEEQKQMDRESPHASLRHMREKSSRNGHPVKGVSVFPVISSGVRGCG